MVQEIARRPKTMQLLPTPPNELEEDNHIHQTVEISPDQIPDEDIKQEFSPPDPVPKDWKKSIIDAVDAESDDFLQFFDAFSAATRSTAVNFDARARWDGYATTAPAASVISSFLAARNTKSMTMGSPTLPSVVSIFDGGEGPCLVLNGLLCPRISSPAHPYSVIKDIPAERISKGLAAESAGTAAIVAAYAYLHSIRQHLIGTVVLEAITDSEDGHLGMLQHLLHTDGRKKLWRGDSMITAASLSSGAPGAQESSSSPVYDRTASRTTDPATFDPVLLRWLRTIPATEFTSSQLSTPCVVHPVATSLSNNSKRILGRRPSIPDFQIGRERGTHARFWTRCGVPSFCISVGGAKSQEKMPQKRKDSGDQCDEKMTESRDGLLTEGLGMEDDLQDVDRKQWIQLVKVLVLTAWDQVGLEE